MNHNEIIKYIKTHFKNMVDDKIKSIEHAIRTNLKKTYRLQNPILHEYCIINTIEEFNRLLSIEISVFSSEIDESIDKYMLTIDNDFFSTHIDISDNKIIPIKIEKIYKESDEDTKPPLIYDNNPHIKILAIEQNNYCGYILYEIKNSNILSVTYLLLLLIVSYRDMTRNKSHLYIALY